MMILIFAGSPLLLWLYSVRFKHQLLIGNLVISVLTGTVPMLVILFEYPLLSRHFQHLPGFTAQGIHALLYWVGSFGFFAFLTNLIREIIKDAEDFSGDKESGSQTIPIRWGFTATRYIIAGLSFLAVGFLGYFFLVHLKDKISLAYYFVLLFLPFGYLIFKSLGAKKVSDWRFLSQATKVIMLLGLLYAPVVHFIIRTLVKS